MFVRGCGSRYRRRPERHRNGVVTKAREANVMIIIFGTLVDMGSGRSRISKKTRNRMGNLYIRLGKDFWSVCRCDGNAFRRLARILTGRLRTEPTSRIRAGKIFRRQKNTGGRCFISSSEQVAWTEILEGCAAFTGRCRNRGAVRIELSIRLR